MTVCSPFGPRMVYSPRARHRGGTEIALVLDLASLPVIEVRTVLLSHRPEPCRLPAGLPARSGGSRSRLSSGLCPLKSRKSVIVFITSVVLPIRKRARDLIECKPSGRAVAIACKPLRPHHERNAVSSPMSARDLPSRHDSGELAVFDRPEFLALIEKLGRHRCRGL